MRTLVKNLDRAVIIGQTTFGKGSVQLVFADVTPEKAALKLTIAQYLTPGDISIQGVGVTPDIELDPRPAAQFIVETIMAAEPGTITLVPTGPLTNIALAARLEPAIVGRVREVVLMGGGAHVGNWSAVAEFNIRL